MFHENPRIFREINNVLTRNGKICVLDYNMKGISKRDFYKRFNFDNEKKAIENEGFENSYKKHTKFDLADCVSLGESVGFKTIEKDVFGKYFLWVGQK